jgi:agarase
MEILGIGAGFSELDWITPKTTWTGFPNVFSPKFEAFCEKMAKRVCGPQKDDPWLVGYFTDNELEWHAWTGKGPFADVFTLPAGHTARKAMVEFIKGRYAAPAEFNEAWGTSVKALDELLDVAAAPNARTDRGRDDVREWIRLLADRYFSVTSAAIRKYDPNHMVMGCRFAGGAPDLLDIAGKYCDVFSVNCYRTVDLKKGVMADDFEDFLADWHSRVGRPFVITEWSFPALDAGLPCRHGPGQRVPTQKDRAFAFTVFQKLLFSTPFVVGSNYFMWADEPELGISSTFPEDSNYGLVNVNDEAYELLTQAATKLHPLVYDIHSGRLADVRVEPGRRRGSFIVENSGAADAVCKVTLWVDGAPLDLERDLGVPAGTSRSILPPAGTVEEPGAHCLVCLAEPREPLLEKGAGDNVATQSIYVPGAPWHDRLANGATVRVPLLVTNASDQPLERVPVAVRLADRLNDATRAGRAVVVDPVVGRAVACQVDSLEEGDEAAFSLERLGPRASKSLFLYLGARAGRQPAPAVRFRRDGDRFEVENAALRLAKTDPASGNTFDRISFGGSELGRFAPLVHQELAQDLWVGPDKVEEVKVHQGPVRLVLDVTSSLGVGHGELKTAVDDEGTRAARESRARSFRTRCRFVVCPDRPWFTSRLVWIENTDSVAWRLGAYFHYLPSNIAGDDSDDEPKGTYWEDKAAGACFGIVPGSRELQVVFWKDKGGGEHPDAFRKLGVSLEPGERRAEEEPVAYVLAAVGRPWEELADEIESLLEVSCRAFEAEKR